MNRLGIRAFLVLPLMVSATPSAMARECRIGDVLYEVHEGTTQPQGGSTKHRTVWVTSPEYWARMDSIGDKEFPDVGLDNKGQSLVENPEAFGEHYERLYKRALRVCPENK